MELFQGIYIYVLEEGLFWWQKSWCNVDIEHESVLGTFGSKVGGNAWTIGRLGKCHPLSGYIICPFCCGLNNNNHAALLLHSTLEQR